MKTAGFKSVFPQSNRRQVIRLLSVAAVLAVATSGCQHQRGGHVRYQAPVVSNYEIRHPIKVRQDSTNMSLDFYQGQEGLSYSQKGRMRRFLVTYKSNGTGPLMISAPEGANNKKTILRALSEIRYTLKSLGIQPHSVDFRPYHGQGRMQVPIQLSYQQYVAQGPKCGNWSKNVALNPQNKPYPNFGCATQSNLAAMISNPRDLTQPRDFIPRSGERRDNAWDRYVQGESTTSEVSGQQSSSTISDVAQ